MPPWDVSAVSQEGTGTSNSLYRGPCAAMGFGEVQEIQKLLMVRVSHTSDSAWTRSESSSCSSRPQLFFTAPFARQAKNHHFSCQV